MILANGRIYETSAQAEILAGLEDAISRTLSEKTLSRETVIDAIDRLGRRVADGEFDEDIAALPIDNAMSYKAQAVQMLSRAYLEFKLRTELGSDFIDDYTTQPPFGMQPLRVKAMPLGVLLHISAGNVDGLPAFSVAEGLLTGNINLLKLPQADNGLTLKILTELIKMAPEIAPFLYVFDTPSSDLSALTALAARSDGVVVWGGDAAVTAARRLAAPGTRLIEWGHKLSFAYLSGYTEDELRQLAEHIVTTRQLLCSSCQTIFLDTEDMQQISAFCDVFLPILEATAERHLPQSVDAAAERTLLQYTRRLEGYLEGGTAAPYQSAFCSLRPAEDRELQLSDQICGCPVKRLPRGQLIAALRKHKNYLQTAGLICREEERAELTALLARSGVVRITRAGDMSASFAGEAHDGDYPLRRYMRIVNAQT